MSRKNNRVWNIPVPLALDEALEKFVEENAHMSKAEAIRDAVRRMLEERGFLKPEGRPK